jgi:hypothetical protein
LIDITTSNTKYFFQIGLFAQTSFNGQQATLQVMPDDHSELVPPLPIPNRTVKRLRADDSAATSVKVGHRQAFIEKPPYRKMRGFCFLSTSLPFLSSCP